MIVGSAQTISCNIFFHFLNFQKKINKVLIHVSTAYANCDRKLISEVVYNSPLQPEKLIETVELIEEDNLKLLTPKLIQSRPNTYTYTKAITETLVVQECKESNLPCAIIRPSIVGASWREPFPGWIDNFNGPSTLFSAIGTGIFRTMLGNFNFIVDIIPVDITVNLMIAVAWQTALKKNTEIKIYNSTSGQINGLTWGMVVKFSEESLSENPLENIFLVPNFSFTTYK